MPYLDPALSAALRGGTIVSVSQRAHVDDPGAGASWTTLLVTTRDHQLLTVELWQDDEGNGPGALVCVAATMLPMPKPRKKG